MSFETIKTREQRKEVSPRLLSCTVIGIGALSRSEGKEDCFIKVPLLITAAATLIEKKILTEWQCHEGKNAPVGNELEWQIMQIMALFVLGGIHKL